MLHKLFISTGKIEITFEKVAPELWSNFGIFERTRTKDENVYSEFTIAAKNFFNHDSFELTLRPKQQRLNVVPVGYHLNFRLTVLGNLSILLLSLANSIFFNRQRRDKKLHANSCKIHVSKSNCNTTRHFLSHKDL